uniref:Uncharacterized protein n=1 Tax=Rhizophora mucronata TaxID=61149 RepID=A0A2P2QVR7_RHIMU
MPMNLKCQMFSSSKFPIAANIPILENFLQACLDISPNPNFSKSIGHKLSKRLPLRTTLCD